MEFAQSNFADRSAKAKRHQERSMCVFAFDRVASMRWHPVTFAEVVQSKQKPNSKSEKNFCYFVFAPRISMLTSVLSDKKLRQCILPTCRGERYDLVHKFPMDTERAKQWLDIIDLPELKQMPLDLVRKRYFVCSKHFLKRDYKNSESRSLNKTAYPKLFLNKSDNIQSDASNVVIQSNTDCANSLLLADKSEASITLLNERLQNHVPNTSIKQSFEALMQETLEPSSPHQSIEVLDIPMPTYEPVTDNKVITQTVELNKVIDIQVPSNRSFVINNLKRTQIALQKRSPEKLRIVIQKRNKGSTSQHHSSTVPNQHRPDQHADQLNSVVASNVNDQSRTRVKSQCEC